MDDNSKKQSFQDMNSGLFCGHICLNRCSGNGDGQDTEYLWEMWRGKLEAVAVCRAGGGEANNRFSRAKGVTRPSMTHCPPRQKMPKE